MMETAELTLVLGKGFKDFGFLILRKVWGVGFRPQNFPRRILDY